MADDRRGGVYLLAAPQPEELQEYEARARDGLQACKTFRGHRLGAGRPFSVSLSQWSRKVEIV